MPDMHSDTWWMRALDGELSPAEARDWEAHRLMCSKCRLEWEALTQADTLLRVAPALPSLPEDFTGRTVARILRQRRQRLALGIAGGLVVVSVALFLELQFLGPAFFRIDHALTAIMAGRIVWLQSLNRLLVSLLSARETILMLVVGGLGLLGVLLTPNSVFATLAFVWLTRDKWEHGQSETAATRA